MIPECPECKKRLRPVYTRDQKWKWINIKEVYYCKNCDIFYRLIFKEIPLIKK